MTREREGNIQKCHPYWDNLPKTLRDGTTITLKEKEDIFPGIIKRTFVLTKGKEEQEITQFHYLEWPDHGVPADPKTFNELMRVVAAHKPKGPIFTHCSAGIGRTGIFIAAYKEKMFIESEVRRPENTEIPTVRILSTLERMRRQRAGLVQTADQMKFLCTCIEDTIRDAQAMRKEQEAKQKEASS